MRLGLFGKILLAFWLTLLVMSQGLWLIYASEHGLWRAGEQDEARIGPPVLALLARRVETDGAAEAERDLRLLPARLADNIHIAPSSTSVAAGRGALRVSRQATAPDGRAYVLTYLPPGSRGSFDIPVSTLVVMAIGGLVFSVALAVYLGRPLARLREGLRRVARGDLDARLEDKLGRRGDEIADLARDFDVMTERLRQLLTARDRLLNDVSHELRSPITRLQLAIGLARQDPGRVADSLDRIEREACRLEAMVQELLTLARAETGAAERELEYFDPVALVERVVADARFEAQARGASVALTIPDIEEDLRPSVGGGAELIHRAVENVVRNAVRFSPAGGLVQVEVRLLDRPPRYAICVRDEGPGADPKALDRLFEPFVRGDAAGVGLGLSIAQRAVRAHGGTIAARNGGTRGLIVEVELPAASDPAQV